MTPSPDEADARGPAADHRGFSAAVLMNAVCLVLHVLGVTRFGVPSPAQDLVHATVRSFPAGFLTLAALRWTRPLARRFVGAYMYITPLLMIAATARIMVTIPPPFCPWPGVMRGTNRPAGGNGNSMTCDPSLRIIAFRMLLLDPIVMGLYFTPGAVLFKRSAVCDSRSHFARMRPVLVATVSTVYVIATWWRVVSMHGVPAKDARLALITAASLFLALLAPTAFLAMYRCSHLAKAAQGEDGADLLDEQGRREAIRIHIRFGGMSLRTTDEAAVEKLDAASVNAVRRYLEQHLGPKEASKLDIKSVVRESINQSIK